MTRKELVDPDFYKFCRQQYDEARRYLKSCGRPEDWYDIFLIREAKTTEEVFRNYV